jgi:hypothetical protein
MEGNAVLYEGHQVFETTEYVRYFGDGKTKVALAIGCRAGPMDNISLENLSHECAHMVEIDERRSFCPSWGLKTRKVVCLGQEFDEPLTWQPTQRECRVIAYQANFMEAMGYAFDVRDFASALRWMPDWCNVPVDTSEDDYSKTEEKRLNFVVAEILKYKADENYSFKTFETIWFKRVARIERLCRRSQKAALTKATVSDSISA